MTQESSSKTLKLAHLYALDHLVQTLYALRFARHQWYEIPHDGARTFNSQAQKDLVDLAISRHEIPAERPSDTARIAHGLWETEKGFTAFVLVMAWFLKVGLKALNGNSAVCLNESLNRLTLNHLDLLHPGYLFIRRPSPNKHLSLSASLLILQ